MLHTSHINVDLSAVEENVRVLREALARPDGENPRLCAVIKADAYGLGSVRIAHRLEKKVDMFAVYTLTEAIELLSASVRTPILVMSPVYSIADSDTLYRAVSHGRLHFSVHALDQALALAKQADRFGVATIHAGQDWRPVVASLQAPVYLSLDLDILDPAFAPGISHHEPGGLNVRELIDLLVRIPGQIVGADVVEYNPDRDIHEMTCSVAAKLVKELAALITRNAAP